MAFVSIPPIRKRCQSKVHLEEEEAEDLERFKKR
jgi:hypothetical protein